MTRLVLALLALSFLPSCFCWNDPKRMQEPGCIVARQVVDCTVDAVTAVAPGLIPAFTNLINTGAMNWDQVADVAASMGFKDAGCLLASLENNFVTKFSASPEHVVKFKMVDDGWRGWKLAHGFQNVKFKVKTADGQEHLR